MVMTVSMPVGVMVKGRVLRPQIVGRAHLHMRRERLPFKL